MHYQFWPLIALIFFSDFYEFWVSFTHRTRACIFSKNVYSNLHPFPYWNHTSLFWSSPIVPRDWKIQGRTSSLPSIVPVNYFLNDRGRLIHTCTCTITFLRAFNNSLSSVTTRYTQVLLHADECQTSDVSKQGKWGGAGETKNQTRRAQIFQFWMLGAT